MIWISSHQIIGLLSQSSYSKDYQNKEYSLKNKKKKNPQFSHSALNASSLTILSFSSILSRGYYIPDPVSSMVPLSRSLHSNYKISNIYRTENRNKNNIRKKTKCNRKGQKKFCFIYKGQGQPPW